MGMANNATDRTLESVLTAQARSRPHAIAIEAIDQAPLAYADLANQMERTRRALRSFGIGPADRVALVLPDGPEAALASLSIAACAVVAPLNPACPLPRLAYDLQNLPAQALVVMAGSGRAAADVARSLGIVVMEIVARGDRAGTFDLSCTSSFSPVLELSHATPDAVALVLYTSGTTARPKKVPLTHANLWTAAHYTAAALDLGPADRSLHVVPMFHIHGLVGALLAPIVSGGTAICTPGFQAPNFLNWLDRFAPTWYTAVPTMHRAIVEQARAYQSFPIQSTLRFIRSVSAPLPTELMLDLERAFDVPVIQGYGMTEAAPQIACNPLPPRVRKPGSVGVPAGPEVAVLDEGGTMLGTRQIGEIAVRGPNVMGGYEQNPDANAVAFVNGWFRTGDQGYRDEDGYLFLTGRLREIINRGGEKIAPREVEEVFLGHPAVAEAVAFGVPDERLGETVALGVVLRSNAQVSEQELRDFAASRLAFFKIPCRVVFLEEIPKSPTGKVCRSGFAITLGLTGPQPPHKRTHSERPRTLLEQELAQLWCTTLDLEQVGIHDNFFVMGGDSISIVEILSTIRRRFDVDLSPQTFLQGPTIAELAVKVDSCSESTARVPGTNRPTSSGAQMKASVRESESRLVVPLQPLGRRAPLFAVHAGGDGHVFLYRQLAARLGTERPFYGVQAVGDWQGRQRPYDPYASLEEVAARYVREIRAIQPTGPYRLAGASFGGTVAFEMARQLKAEGEKVAALFLFSSHVRNNPHKAPASRLSELACNAAVKSIFRVIAGRWPCLYRVIFSAHEISYQWRLRWGRPPGAAAISARFYRESRLLISRYKPEAYDGRAILFRATSDEDPVPLWTGLAREGLHVHDIPGGHLDILAEPAVVTVANAMRNHLADADRREALADHHDGASSIRVAS